MVAESKQVNPWLHQEMFKKKSKKSPTPAVPLPVSNDNLEDDLFAQLDAQDQPGLAPPANATPQSSTTLATTSTESGQSSKLQKLKKDSKLRFKAREVSAFFHPVAKPLLFTSSYELYYRRERLSK